MKLVSQEEFSLNVFYRMITHKEEPNELKETVATYYDDEGYVIGQIIRPSQFFLPEGDEIA